MDEKRLLTMLGFAMRAGKLTVGTELTISQMSARGVLKLVLVCEDTSSATKKKVLTKAQFYGIRAYAISLTQDALGMAIGKEYSPACVGVRDEGFAEQMLKAINS